MDPISITGLAIAVFDQLWKVGERTAPLIMAYQDFDQVEIDLCVFSSKLSLKSNRIQKLWQIKCMMR